MSEEQKPREIYVGVDGTGWLFISIFERSENRAWARLQAEVSWMSDRQVTIEELKERGYNIVKFVEVVE